MPDVVNDDFVLSDFIHDQIIAHWKAPEFRFACCLAHEWRLGNSRCNFFYAHNQACRRRRVILCDICENLIEIGKCTALVSKLHALR